MLRPRSHLGFRLGFALGLAALALGLSAPAADSGLVPAIVADDQAKVKAILAADPAALNREIEFHSFPLAVAVAHFKPAIVRLLVEQGADVNAVDKRGDTALHLLAKTIHQNYARFDELKAMLVLLCDRKADLNRFDQHGRTPLYLLAQSHHPAKTLPQKLELVRLMAERGASLKATQDKKVEPLGVFMVTDGQFLTIFKDKNTDERRLQERRNLIDTLRLLLELGMDPNQCDPNPDGPGDTLLLAVMKTPEVALPVADKIELLKLLIDHGVNKNQKNRKGEKPDKLLDGRKDPLYETLKKYRPAKPPAPRR